MSSGPQAWRDELDEENRLRRKHAWESVDRDDQHHFVRDAADILSRLDLHNVPMTAYQHERAAQALRNLEFALGEKKNQPRNKNA